ncbi:Ribosomal protein S6 kinase-like 1 [Fukomys damarensis]|uniref:Ribosomal protein S6 kinase-like 1 n=1 Tax=Fukomys damarensis TaxID=885580 RepID=A0A091DN97_FUKDA|nr:Ribosomal protein S6 kinase-like 1 [Fukomys damarensis]
MLALQLLTCFLQLLAGLALPTVPPKQQALSAGNSSSEVEVVPFQEVWGRSYCRTLEKLVDIVTEYPSEVQYMFSPSCVSLKRCTGCCGDERLQCTPVETANITMQILKITPGVRPFYVQLTFLQHTLCECRPLLEKTNPESQGTVILAPLGDPGRVGSGLVKKQGVRGAAQPVGMRSLGEKPVCLSLAAAESEADSPRAPIKPGRKGGGDEGCVFSQPEKRQTICEDEACGVMEVMMLEGQGPPKTQEHPGAVLAQASSVKDNCSVNTGSWEGAFRCRAPPLSSGRRRQSAEHATPPGGGCRRGLADPSHREAMSLVACECLPSPGLEPEPCSRPRSQACVYLEQIRSRVATGAPDMTKCDYLVDAATQIRLALERDVSEDYEAAFNHYQNGVDVLLRGVHVDPNKERREAVKLKITKYLRRAEEIFNCHLQRSLGSGSSPDTGFSSLRLRPIRTLSSALEQLRGCRVVGVIDKSLPRCHVASQERLTVIPHGVPYMTKLLRYFVSEDSIFLHLEHVQGGTLWSHLRSQVHPQHSGLRSGSTQKTRAQLDTCLGLLTPARLPQGHTFKRERIPVEHPRTSQSLPPATPAREALSLRPQGKPECESISRTSASCSSDLTKASSGPLHLQARRAGQSSDTGLPQGLPWVREGASRVLGGCGQGRGHSPPAVDRSSVVCGGAVWSVREEQVKQWAAEMLVALEALHEQGVLCRDLNPRNLLLDQAEVGGIAELTEACDWWSFGSILYELLTGMALSQSHRSGFQAHTQLQLPEELSYPAASLLTEGKWVCELFGGEPPRAPVSGAPVGGPLLLQWGWRRPARELTYLSLQLLQFDPVRRLGARGGGVSKLKSHPFFSTIQWSRLVG